MKRLTPMILSVFVAAFLPAAAFSADTILVAGFRNLGPASDANINIVLTKSLISLLGRAEEIRIVSYDTAEKLAASSGFRNTNAAVMDTVENMGLTAGASKVVFGDYRIDGRANVITVNYSIYDVRNGQILMSRKLTGPAGMDVFDTIDSIAKKVAIAAAGREIDFETAPPAITNAAPAVVTTNTVRVVVTNTVPASNTVRILADPNLLIGAWHESNLSNFNAPLTVSGVRFGNGGKIEVVFSGPDNPLIRRGSPVAVYLPVYSADPVTGASNRTGERLAGRVRIESVSPGWSIGKFSFAWGGASLWGEHPATLITNGAEARAVRRWKAGGRLYWDNEMFCLLNLKQFVWFSPLVAGFELYADPLYRHWNGINIKPSFYFKLDLGYRLTAALIGSGIETSASIVPIGGELPDVYPKGAVPDYFIEQGFGSVWQLAAIRNGQPYYTQNYMKLYMAVRLSFVQADHGPELVVPDLFAGLELDYGPFMLQFKIGGTELVSGTNEGFVLKWGIGLGARI